MGRKLLQLSTKPNPLEHDANESTEQNSRRRKCNFAHRENIKIFRTIKYQKKWENPTKEGYNQMAEKTEATINLWK